MGRSWSSRRCFAILRIVGTPVGVLIGRLNADQALAVARQNSNSGQMAVRLTGP